MAAETTVYRRLQEHLNAMPVGFPATKTGVEINLLKEIFTPEEASVATHLDYKHKTVDQIFETAQAEVDSKEQLARILDSIVSKGGITRRRRNGERQYAVLPLLLWGMYEHQLKRLSPEFLENFGAYMQGEMQLELATGTVPMMRVIPVEESVEAEHYVATYDELRRLIEQAGDQIAIQECLCRKIADQKGENCQATDRREVCMSLGDLADLYVEEGWARRLTQEEALEIARKNEEEGLVLMPGNQQEAQFMCACCSDCCSMMTMMKFVPKPADVVASNFFAEVDAGLCKGNGICVERCPTDAVTLDSGVSSVDLTRCIGCGVCVPTCPEGAIQLVNKEEEVVPPVTETDLRDAILAPKKTFTGRLRNTFLKTFMRVAMRFSR
jgi:Pyruvate/2-oxoacid:ferredoxin oxidoreductase delta subunit